MKTIFKSKTFWANLLMGLLSILAVINPEFLELIGLNSVKALTIIGFITSVINIVLRLITTTAIETKKKDA